MILTVSAGSMTRVTTKSRRRFPDIPITIVRLGSIRSGASSAKGSSSAEAASSKETPCFATLLCAFAGARVTHRRSADVHDRLLLDVGGEGGPAQPSRGEDMMVCRPSYQRPRPVGVAAPHG